MNTSDARDALSEQEVESLLRDFFAQEIPKSFEFPRATLVSRSVTSEAPHRSSRSGVIAVATMICALAVVAILARGESVSQQTADHQRQSQPNHPSPLPDMHEGTILERKTIMTENGPVEERSHLKYTTVTVEDPKTGRKVEVMLPELEIELYPLERPAPEKLPE